MQFGQFLDHDLTLTPVLRDQQGYQVDCSRCDADPERCDPIEIPLNDPFFPSHDAETGQRKCMEFVKSQSVDTFGYRDQLNLVTAWYMDGTSFGHRVTRKLKNSSSKIVKISPFFFNLTTFLTEKYETFQTISASKDFKSLKS